MSNNWPLVALGEILNRVERFEKRDDLNEYQFAGTYSFGRGIFVGSTKSGSSFNLDKIQRIHTEDFVYCKIMAWEGAFGLVPKEAHNCVMSGAFVAYEIDKTRLHPKYLEYYFKIEFIWKSIGGQSTGTNVRRRSLHPGQFEAVRIPLPPLDEQRRIVARIEELAAKVEQARELRRRVGEEVERLIGAMAQNLFSENNPTNYLIEELCDVRGGIQKSKDRIPDKNPRRYITVAHVQRNWIDISDPRYFEVSDVELENWRLISGDILVVEGNGSAEQIGRTALFRGEIEDCVHQNHIIRVRPNQSRILPEYLNVYLNNPLGQEQMRERSRTTSGLFNLSVGRIKTIQIPLLPLAEQRGIVAYLDNLQGKVEAVKRQQAGSAVELAALLPSILDRAFKGEL